MKKIDTIEIMEKIHPTNFPKFTTVFITSIRYSTIVTSSFQHVSHSDYYILCERHIDEFSLIINIFGWNNKDSGSGKDNIGEFIKTIDLR